MIKYTRIYTYLADIFFVRSNAIYLYIKKISLGALCYKCTRSVYNVDTPRAMFHELLVNFSCLIENLIYFFYIPVISIF